MSLYIHAVYWSIVTFSSVGVGDVGVVSIGEKTFTILALCIGFFSFAIIFGNIASMVSDLGPRI